MFSFEVLMLLEFYVVQIDSYLPTHLDNLSAASSRVKHSKKKVVPKRRYIATNLSHMTSYKREDLIYTASEA
jgi:hypothetical protein